jgi:hypothetical protein
MKSLATLCVVAAAAVIAAAPVHAAPAPTGPVPQAPFKTDSPNPCAAAPIKQAQLVGKWLLGDGPQVSSFNADGTYSRELTSGTVEKGTWSYDTWDLSPAADRMPASAKDTCVIWFNPNSHADPYAAVYVPLSITDKALEVSLVGRGNTLEWRRA